MAFPPNLLSNDEVIVLDLVPHWWYIVKSGSLLGLAVVLGLIAVLNDYYGWVNSIVGLLLLIALGYFGIKYAQWRSTNFVITNERVITRTGVVSKKGMEIPVDRINTVFFEQGAFERMIGAGSLMVESAGEGGQQVIPDVRSPSKVQSEIYAQMEAFEARRVGRMGDAMAGAVSASQPSGPSVPAQIKELDQLRQDGLLSEEEYAAKKKELLDRM
ncbi:MAG: PH domain-containing protein [Acidobacteria bacterium]|nr:PH domain-containing protein [Acidobacteriota bacterium]